MSVQTSRATLVRSGVRIEIFTVLWMVVEASVSIGAGVLAHSALLTAFGIDSVVELVSGAILLWRLSVEARGETTEQVERAEHRAAWVVAVSLALLCLYVLVTGVWTFVSLPPGQFAIRDRDLGCGAPGDAGPGFHQTTPCNWPG